MPSNHPILCRPLLLLPSIFPASGSFPMSQLFTSGSQSVGVSASTSVLPMNTQDWSPLGWTGWISLQSKGVSRVFSNTTVQKHQFFSGSYTVQHPLLRLPERICLQCRRPNFNPWVRKILWRREWQDTPVFLPGESHGQRSLVGLQSMGSKESVTSEFLTLHFLYSQSAHSFPLSRPRLHLWVISHWLACFLLWSLNMTMTGQHCVLTVEPQHWVFRKRFLTQ